MATVSDPYPSDGDTNGASPDIVLRWQAAADAAASYDIYVGTDQTAVVNGDGDVHFGPRSGTTYAPTRPLVAGKTYYWRVAQVNRGNQDPVEPGPVWSFRVFSSAGQPAGYEKGYATWAVNTMTPVNLCDALPDGAVSAPSVSVKLARCESTGFQLAIQPAFDRRLDHVRLVISDLTSAGNILAASHVSWQVVGVIRALHFQGSTFPDVLLPVTDFNAATNRTHSILVTVQAPAGAVAGIYTGTITVKTDSGLDTTVTVSATVYDFAISAVNTVGAMHLRNTWTLVDWGNAVEYQAYGDLLLSYRMCPDHIYRYKPLTPVDITTLVATLEHWYSLGLNTFSIFKTDNLSSQTALKDVGGEGFLKELGKSLLAKELLPMAQFYGYDEKPLAYYRDGGAIPMRPLHGRIKAAYQDIPITTTCDMNRPPWADPVGDMIYYHCDWICVGKSRYKYADGRLLRTTHDPGLPGPPPGQRFQYWAYYEFPLLRAALLEVRTSFWGLFEQQADGFLYYRVNGWWELDAKGLLPVPIDPMVAAHQPAGPIIPYAYTDPGLDPTKRQRERVASSAVLVYRGTTGPLASMRMVNIRDGMQDWEYLWAIGHYGADGVTRLGKIASVETARELAEEVGADWGSKTSPTQVFSRRDAIAAWLSQPYVARYPMPEHRSTGVNTSPTLSWQSDSPNVTSFDVYFGANRSGVLNATTASREFFKGNQLATTFNPEGPLARNRSYYWRIDEVVNGQPYKGYVWSLSCSHGLVGWWKFDESTGTTAKDSSGLGRDATIANATHVTGLVSKGLQFTGAGVSMPASVLSTIDGQITLAFWLYGAEVQPQNGVVFEALTAGGATVLRGLVPSSAGVACFEAGGGDVVSQPMRLTQARSRWQFWTFTKNADTGHMKIYLNGVLWADACGRTEVMQPAAAFTVGSGYAGKIDEFRVYDNELQPAEIAALYESSGRRGDRGLMGWWRFDELSGSNVQDSSDLQHHGTLVTANQARRHGEKFGSCLVFNGTSDYVEVDVQDKTMTFPGKAMTLSLWTHEDFSLPGSTNPVGAVAVCAFDTNGQVSLAASIPLTRRLPAGDSIGSIFFMAGFAKRDRTVTGYRVS